MKFKYQALLDSDDFVTVVTPQRVRKFANKAFIDFMSKSEAEILGVDFTKDLYEGKVPFFDTLIKNITPSNPKVSLIQKMGPPGKEGLVSWRASGIFDKDGNLVEILNIGRNISELVDLEKQNQELSSRLNAFTKAIDKNIICTITDTKGVITYANERFYNVSQYNESEIIGNTHKLINSGYHPDEFFRDLWKTITAGEVWSGEIRNKAKDGSYYWVNSVIMPIVDADDKITGYLSLRILVTEQKRLEAEKNEYIKSLEQMLFMVSHEIRRPIASCYGLLTLMRDEMPVNKEDYIQAIDYLLSSVKELDAYSHSFNEQLSRNIRNYS